MEIEKIKRQFFGRDVSVKLENIEKVISNIRYVVHNSDTVLGVPGLMLVTNDGKIYGVYDADLIRIYDSMMNRVAIINGSIALNFKQDDNCQVGFETVTFEDRRKARLKVVSCEPERLQQ